MSSAINVSHLSKSFTYYKKSEGFWSSVKALFHREQLTKHAVTDISFTIEPGEFVAFLGANGAGKTTTLKMLSGILTPTSGDIRVLDFVPQERTVEFKKSISIVMGQKYQLWPTLPAIDTFRLVQQMYEIKESTYQAKLKELTELLDVVDLLQVQTRKLSLGQRMKCELIASLLYDPKVLFLDEPTIGLDINSKQTIRAFLRRYNAERKTTILLTSHDMDDIKNLCQRLIIINEGKMVLDGALDDIIKLYSTNKIIKLTFDEPVKKKDLSAVGKIMSFSPYESELSIPASASKEKIGTLVSQFPVNDITIEDVTLEEIIGDLIK